MTRTYPWLLAGALVVSGLKLAEAQERCSARECRATNAVSVRVGTILRLTTDGSAVVQAVASPAAYHEGYQGGTGPVLTVRSNGPWRLQINAAPQGWTSDAVGAAHRKPVSDLSWSGGEGGRYTPLEATAVDLARGFSTDGTVIPVFFRTRFDREADAPGTYALVIQYTLTTM